ncbi:MAG: hypothetical protein ACJAQT_004106 [Akkermansiaceae bacterium]|jgi:hypothetical protein
MAFDLVIGKSDKVKDDPVIFGSIEHDDYIAITRLDKKHPNWFLNRMSNVFDDQRFGADELAQAAEILDELILKTRESEDCRVLLKLSAAVSMAIRKGFPLFGVAD